MIGGRLIGHPGGFDLGPKDVDDWLRGSVSTHRAREERQSLAPLACRIAENEEAALELLQPDNGDEDWPEEIREGGAIELYELGRHSAAARWAIRGAVVRGWQRACDVPSRATRKHNMKGILASVTSLLGKLRTLSQHDRMALQRAGLKGGSKALPARPDLDGNGSLIEQLLSLEAATGADLKRLDSLGKAYRWPDYAAGSAENMHVTMAHEAVPLWLHFRAHEKPTESTGRRSFSNLAGILHEMVTDDRQRDMKRDVRAALDYYSEAIRPQYAPR